MLIFLTGMPASGKSTTGKLLAAELGFGFLDLDDLVVAAEKMPIAGIFSEKGEEYFRKAETKVLRKLQEAKNTVVATGGGAPCFYDNMQWMNRHGLTIFLDTPLEEIKARLETSECNRPLFSQNKKPLAAFLIETKQQRSRFYQQAAIIINPAAVPVRELAQLVQEQLEPQEKRNE